MIIEPQVTATVCIHVADEVNVDVNLLGEAFKCFYDRSEVSSLNVFGMGDWKKQLKLHQKNGYQFIEKISVLTDERSNDAPFIDTLILQVENTESIKNQTYLKRIEMAACKTPQDFNQNQIIADLNMEIKEDTVLHLFTLRATEAQRWMTFTLFLSRLHTH